MHDVFNITIKFYKIYLYIHIVANAWSLGVTLIYCGIIIYNEGVFKSQTQFSAQKALAQYTVIHTTSAGTGIVLQTCILCEGFTFLVLRAS